MSVRSSVTRLEPILLLLASGACIGLIFPLGKVAGEWGIPPLLYAGLAAAGASFVLGLLSLATGERIEPTPRALRYALVAGQLTFAIPFGVLVVVIPNLGSGIPAILQSLAPILTLAIVYALGMERPNAMRVAGLACGLAGAVIILIARNTGTLGSTASIGWYLAAFVTPLALAAGNVYRSRDWPPGVRALPLAALTVAAAAAGLFILIGIMAAAGIPVALFSALRDGWLLILAQSVATGIGYAFFFRLQQVGGPVYLSQISYVNTSVGVAFALLFFGEELTPWLWLAVLFVFAGIAFVNRTQTAER